MYDIKDDEYFVCPHGIQEENRFLKAESKEHHGGVKDLLKQQACNKRSEIHWKEKAILGILLFEGGRLERWRDGRLLHGQVLTRGTTA